MEDNLRQKELANQLSENGGKMPLGKLMIKAGYSEAYAKNPNHLKKTLSWQELMEKYLPDKLLSRRHKQLLNKKDPTGQIDSIAVSKGLEMAYKLKNKYPAEKHDITSGGKPIPILSGDLNVPRNDSNQKNP